MFLPLYLLDSKLKFFFLINSCVLEMLDIFHPCRFLITSLLLILSSIHLCNRTRCSFTGIKRDDCWKWTCGFPLLFVIMTWFTMMIYHFLFVFENYQNCQLTLTENYGLFGLLCLSFPPSLPLYFPLILWVEEESIFITILTSLPCLFGLWRFEFLLETCSVFWTAKMCWNMSQLMMFLLTSSRNLQGTFCKNDLQALC